MKLSASIHRPSRGRGVACLAFAVGLWGGLGACFAQIETLRLKAEGTKFQATLESKQGDYLAGLQVGEVIELPGLVVATGTHPPRALQLASAREASSLGADPVIARQWLIKLASLAGALGAAAGLWIWLLRRQVAECTAALAAEIEERRKAQIELDRALANERQLGELKSRFVSLVSHEFRTPLGITMSAVELLRHYFDRLTPENLRELLDDIHSATLRMSGLMEQVLLLGRVEAGKIGFQDTPLDLDELGGKLADEALSATNRKCPIEFHAENDLAGARGDEGLIRHILSNLLTNGVKYSPDGEDVKLLVQREEDCAVFVVRDRGLGIPPADQERLFEAFHRGSNVSNIPGTGLGLLIVKRCVELHQGTMAFVSREGEGTTFTVRLPLFPGAAA